jgi:hypothetical protein
MDCSICIEPFNKSARSKVECSFCHYTACRICVKRILLDSALQPSCTNCKVAWDPEYIRTIMPKAFLDKAYKQHREETLLSLEESMLPETQAFANFQNEMDRGWYELVELKNLIKTLKDDYTTKYNQHLRKYNRGFRGTQEKRQFIMKCPDNDCRGFLSTQYKCGQCNTNYCKDCYASKENDTHVCHPDDVKTVELLQTNTKRCPKCSISIFKVDGCNQMWCTECKTAFSWDTGRIINGVVHNPHYFEWQRQHNVERAVGDVDDPNICPNDGMTPPIRRFRFLAFEQQTKLTSLIQVLVHVREVIIPSLSENEDRFVRNRDIRIDYLNQRITREHFKWMVQKRDKASQKKRLMVMLWQMFVMSYNDLLNNLLLNKDFRQFENENQELLKYINSEFTRVGKLYSTRVRILNQEWRLVYAE